MSDGTETVRCRRCGQFQLIDPDHDGDVQCSRCGAYLKICGGTTNALGAVDDDGT